MKIFTAVFILTAFVAPLEAQWLERRTPGIPRTADGKPNLTAPAPRTADDKPELTGLWQMISPDGAIGNVSLRKPGDLQQADIQPWAQALGSQSAAMRALKGREMEALSPLQGYLRWGTHDPALTRWAIL